MSRFIGFAITGLAVYLAINSLPDLNTRTEHDTAVAIATDNREGMARDITLIANTGRSFSPSNPMTARTSSDHIKTVVASSQPAHRMSPPRDTSSSVIVRAAERVRTTGTSRQLATTEPASTLPPVLINAVMVTPAKPENIVRETQRELKRVGCYRGRIDGKWGRGSRKSLRKYVRRSGIIKSSRGRYRTIAAKPTAGILNSLRKTARKICGRPCASGTMLSANGRCIKDPVIMASLTAEKTFKPANSGNSNHPANATPGA